MIGCHGSRTARRDAGGQWLTTWQPPLARGVLACSSTPPPRRREEGENSTETKPRQKHAFDCCKGATGTPSRSVDTGGVLLERRRGSSNLLLATERLTASKDGADANEAGLLFSLKRREMWLLTG